MSAAFFFSTSLPTNKKMYYLISRAKAPIHSTFIAELLGSGIVTQESVTEITENESVIKLIFFAII